MSDWDVLDVVMLVVVGALAFGVSCLLIACGSIERFTTWRTRRWLRQTLGIHHVVDDALVRRVLAGRDRARGWGALAGLVLAVAFAPPHPVNDFSLTDNLGLWLTSLLAGFWLGGTAQTMVEVRTARVPEGVRVAASTPRRVGWYVSKIAVLLLTVAVAVQATRGVLRIRQVWPWVGPSTMLVAAIVALCAMITMTAAILIMTPWLASRPVFAGDDGEFDLRIRLRREHVRTSLMVMYGLVYSVSAIINEIGTDAVPFEVRRSWPTWWYSMSLVAIMIAFGGLLRQVQVDKRWTPPPPQPDSGTGTNGFTRTDTYAPAPGTNGWVFSRHAR